MIGSFHQIFVLFLAAAITDNIVLNKFLGICPFLGVSKKLSSAYQMGLAVTFVMVFSTFITWIIHKYILIPFNLEFLKIISFILIIASLVQFLEMYLKKFFQEIYDGFGIYLPLITTNCAILGVAFLNIQNNHNIIETIVYPFSAGMGFLLALILIGSIREKLEFSNIPKCFKGTPITLIVAGIMALIFGAFKTLI